MKRWGVALAALFITIGAGGTASASEKPASMPAPHPPAMMGPAAASGLSGKVVETMNAGGYTYVCLEKGKTKTWVAVPEMKVVVGSHMTFRPGQVMTGFRSKTLGRTFDAIVFSGGPATGGHDGPHGAPGSMAPARAKAVKVKKVGKAAGPDAYTIAEIYAKRSALDKKTVVVKGTVVKVSQGIMNRNWIHLQDGTGNQAKGTHDLVVTSQDLPAVGDVVTVSGTLAKDRDIGAGYRYRAIIEQAKIRK